MEILSRDDLVTILPDLNPQPAHFLNMQSDGSFVHTLTPRGHQKDGLVHTTSLRLWKKEGRKKEKEAQRPESREMTCHNCTQNKKFKKRNGQFAYIPKKLAESHQGRRH
jgi:hypothetical protein